MTDTGVGMTDEVARRAFEPFFTTKGPSGSGLGLSQVYGMARESGGTVRLVTSAGGGTSVTLLLPRAAEMPKSGRPQTEQRRMRPGVKVLVVDDDPDVLKVSAEMLRQLGYRVTTATSGQEALAALATKPAIVMLDHAMPAMTGLEAAAAMRERGFVGPIILATGYAELSEAEQTELASCRACSTSPTRSRTWRRCSSRVEGMEADATLQGEVTLRGAGLRPARSSRYEPNEGDDDRSCWPRRSVVPPAAWPQPPRDQSVETVTIRLSNFAFNPEQLRLRVGVPVRLHLENRSSGGHNFSSPALFAASILPDWFAAAERESRGRWQEQRGYHTDAACTRYL